MSRRGAWIWALLATLPACGDRQDNGTTTLRWYTFVERSGAFAEAVSRCTQASAGEYRLEMVPLPADADQQREQLVRRLAAGDADIDLIGMDVIWTAEFAQAGWILPWNDHALAVAATAGRLPAAVAGATYQGRLWAAPFTSNGQLLWYRKDRVPQPPATWQRMMAMAEASGRPGAIQAQGERYEGLAVLFVSLLASAGGSVLDDSGRRVSLPEAPTRTALSVLKRLATSPAADPGLSTGREDQARLAFETGVPDFMVNYSYVWTSAATNAPRIAAVMGWSRWPGVAEGLPGRVAIGGLNIGIGARSRHPRAAFHAAGCLVAAEHQKRAARLGGLPPTLEALYDDADVRRAFPFADLLRETLRDAVQRPQSPLYGDISLAIVRILHPLEDIDPARDVQRLRDAVSRALHSEGLM